MDLRSVLKFCSAFFLHRGTEHWRRGERFRAMIFWACPIVLALLMLGTASWAFPIHMEISRGLRQFVYFHFNFRPPFGLFFPTTSLAPKFVMLDPSTRESHQAIDQMVCYSHEIISVSMKIEEPTYLLVFGFDGHQPYRMTDSPLAVQSRAAGEFKDTVQLDTAEADETIYVIASSLPFDFERDVRPMLTNTTGSSRGGTPTHAALPLSPQLQQQSFTCHHSN